VESILLAFKTVKYGSTVKELDDMFSLSKTSKRDLLSVNASSNKFPDRSIVNVAIRNWNKLPSDLKHIDIV
jgi:hypothetical protein